ncbi:MAG: hypothetical protein PVF17_00645 [Ignavibacteria bacterium]
MTQPQGQNPTSYLGVDAPNPPNQIIAQRAPTGNDIGYSVGTEWLNQPADDWYKLSRYAAGVAQWVVIGTNITLPISVVDGGTGATTFTDHGVLVGSGTSAITPIAVATNGQVLLGSTGADPVFASITSSDLSILYTPGAGTLSAQVNPNLIQQKVTTLSAAEIKALATTPIELVAAPAAGSIIEFKGASFKLVAGSEVLTEAGDNLGIKYTDASGVQVSQTIECTGFIDQAADTYTNAEPAIDSIVVATSAEAQALVLDNLNNNFGGNASNDAQLIVSVSFRTVTI